jgi:Zn-dependent protease
MHFNTKIPITIRLSFILTTALLGGLIGKTSNLGLIMVPIFVLVALVSILFHEYGHALMALIFKEKPHIELMALGGVTIYPGRHLTNKQQFIITLAGPFFGFLLYLISTAVLFLFPSMPPPLMLFWGWMQLVNLSWTVLNMIPVLPLDGGQLVRVVLESFWGVKGLKATLIIGMAASLILVVVGFVSGQLFLPVIFFLFGFQSYEMYQNSKMLTQYDRKKDLSDLFYEAERLLKTGRRVEAEKLFERIARIAKEGILHAAAISYLAQMRLEEKKRHEAYELLLSVQSNVNKDMLPVLHELAFEEKNYPLVTKLSSDCYQILSTQEVALRNSKAYGFLHQAKPSGGWLKTALDFGTLNYHDVVKEEPYPELIKEKDFHHFFPKEPIS